MKNKIILKEAIKDQCVPDDFYSTTNLPTYVCLNGSWVEVENQRMDAMILIQDDKAYARKLRDIKKGDLIVCGDNGIKVDTNYDESTDSDFGFMANSISSERRNELVIKRLAKDLVRKGEKLTIVAGPVVVHTGGDVYLRKLIREGYVQSLLGGNAVAVHDIEKSYFNTSLGVDADTGKPVLNGYRNHMRAINRINKYRSIRKAVESKDLKSGIMYECVNNEVPFVLAGSLRDDGPLPDTLFDMEEAQNRYSQELGRASIVLILGTMLHGIASGNMLAAEKLTICVDISPSSVTKLSDRGSSQSIGVVTDVGLFLKLLYYEILKLKE